MTPDRRSELDALCRREVVEAGVAPAAVVAVAAGPRLAVGAGGQRRRGPSEPAAPEMPFDLASVSKPVFAATAVRRARRGELDLDAPLGRWLPEACDTPSADVPLALLLSHRAGLVAHQTLFAPLVAQRGLQRSDLLRQAAAGRRAECSGPPPPEGFAPLYSDLGYLLAGEAVARAAALSLDELIAREVTEPLGLEMGSARQWLARDAQRFFRAAPTEIVPWRGGELCGVVHDENAWALAGHGAAGHAGLFGTAEAVCRFGVALLDALAGRDDAWLRREDVEWMVKPRPGGDLRAGFDGKSATGSSAGDRASAQAFGHLGFTGTSLWCDPATERAMVVLTNRVHPSREHIAIRSARPKLHDALAAVPLD
ncbi:MAG: beta-lactamase family protein [Myxococcales bacterium]|nr:beta-lactamase family protein [Myxococcales bacterium]